MKDKKEKSTKPSARQDELKRVAGDVEGHRKLLAVVPAEAQKQRLEALRLKEEVLRQPWLICPPEPLHPNARLARPYLHPLDIRSLDDLKAWVGIPNHVAQERAKSTVLHPCGGCWGPVADVNLSHLPRIKSFQFSKLDLPQRETVHQVARNLLFGYVDKEEARKVPIVGVVDYLIERARGWVSLVIPDLIICPGQRVELSGFPAAFFNNILIYGSGELALRGQIKVHAYQIRRV